MSTSPDAAERRKVSAVARRYERDGYRVTRPDRDGRLPAFLEGFRPDLIAENEHDRVVVEVKRSDAVRGANELLEVAERVAGAPGWRFELVTLPARERVSPPSVARLDAIETQIRQIMRAGLAGAAYLSAFAILEELLRDLAVQSGMKAARLPLAQIVRDLTSRGLLSRDDLEAIERAEAFRTRFVHADGSVMAESAEVDALLTLARRVRGGPEAMSVE